MNGQPNGYEAAQKFRQGGFSGCWVVALGCNDAANVAKGSSVNIRDRIVRMMSVIGSDPVVWINQRTTTDSGWWANKNMQAWNQVLVSLAPSYANLRIFDWATVSQEVLVLVRRRPPELHGLGEPRQPYRGRPRCGLPRSCGLGALYLDLDVDARREVEALQRVDRLRRVVDDVDQPLVDPHLEVLAGVLVLVG